MEGQLLQAEFLIGILQNAVLLLGLVFVYSLTAHRLRGAGPLLQQVAAGVLIGLIAVAIMSAPVMVESEFRFDARSVLFAVVGLLASPVSSLTAVILGMGFRWSMGGPGALAGTILVLTSAAIGLAWRIRRQGHLHEIGWLELLGLGYVVHGVMAILVWSLPFRPNPEVTLALAASIFGLLPVATVATGLLLQREMRWTHTRERLRLLGSALEATAHAVVITNRNGVVEWVNPAFTHLTGYTAEEARGRKPGELLRSGEQDEAFYRTMWETILAGRVWRGRLTNRRKDGTLYLEEQTITPLRDEFGTLTHFIGVKQDLTEARSLEEQFRQAQKLEGVALLAGGAAHDFNNVLAVINTSLDLAIRESAGDPELAEDLRRAREAGERGRHLTQQLLAYSRRDQRATEAFDLNALLGQAIAMFDRLVGRGLTVELDLAPGPLLVRMDPNELEQVLMNLVVNARDAMSGKGTLTVRSQRVSSLPSGLPLPGSGTRWVSVEVRDTGTGMTPETVAQAFEPFFTTKPPGSGTGLGLSTARRVVEEAGGTISLESRPGEGTSVRIHLPEGRDAGPRDTDPLEASPGEPENPVDRADPVKGQVVMTGRGNGARSPKVAPGEAGAPPWILLVEDNPTIRRTMERALRRLGYRVSAVASGDDALGLLPREASASQTTDLPDLWLSDVEMPGMDGLALVRILREKGLHQPVIFVTGRGQEELDPEMLAELDADLLRKPFSMEELEAVTVEALSRSGPEHSPSP